MTKGSQQDPDISVGETFSSVAKMAIVRVVLTIATFLNRYVKQVDINNTFLNGTLQEPAFMNQSECFVD